ncbi:MAG: efflux RND transporter periplasmic adaptor subunit [Candidatus Omnitrophica bacterium]|nr:efflux RND transporter periplasmic adaptor subunit [Candidatus Omnitrophota bacterium]
MLKNKYIIAGLAAVVLVSAVLILKNLHPGRNMVLAVEEISPRMGDIKVTITTTGDVEPQNRLEIKPSINGRVEEILVQEGDMVKKGQVLARMSSTERAALIDAARSQGESTLRYWQEVYKETPLISPIDGEVIVRSVEPGQTVTTSEPVLVISDRLIVNAQFDETDIGRVKVGQKAIITLDAYPQYEIKGVVDHIAYESSLVNNVTIYDVTVVPEDVPDFFRSGMSANVEITEKGQKDALLVPVEAVRTEDGATYVKVKAKTGNGTENRRVETGISDEKNVEIISGLKMSDIVILQNQNYTKKRENAKTNPFMPFRRR